MKKYSTLFCVLISVSVVAQIKDIKSNPSIKKPKTQVSYHYDSAKKTTKNHHSKMANFDTEITKEERLDADYYKPFDSTTMRSTISNYINRIDKICEQKQLSVNQKINNLANILQALRASIDSYLANPYLKSTDSIYLTSIQYNISRTELSLGKKITPALVHEYKFNLSQIFVNSYSLFYNINRESASNPDGYEVTENPFFYPSHPWANKIYRGLQCTLK